MQPRGELPGDVRELPDDVRELPGSFRTCSGGPGHNHIGMSRTLAKWIAHLGHLQGGLYVSYVGLQARCIQDASDLQVRKWTCKHTYPT